MESCLRTGGFLPGLTRPPPVAPLETVGFCGARKIRAAPPVISRTRVPPPVMSWAVAMGHAGETATAKPKQSAQKRRFLMQTPSPSAQITTHSGQRHKERACENHPQITQKNNQCN